MSLASYIHKSPRHSPGALLDLFSLLSPQIDERILKRLNEWCIDVRVWTL